MISQTSAGGMFKSMSSLKSEVILRANQFAESKGKVAIPVASKEHPAYPGHMPNFEYQFMLVGKEDPRASGNALVPRPDVVVEHVEKNQQNQTTDQPKTKNVYDELLKLDELRKKGIITEAEFLSEKSKLLNSK